MVKFKRVIGVLAALATAGITANSAQAGSDADKLGKAYRAFLDHDYEAAQSIARTIQLDRLKNPDYAIYARAQSELLTGRPAAALESFKALGAMTSSRFSSRAAWGAADCLWELGKSTEAAETYKKLLRGADKATDIGLVRFRIAEAAAKAGRKAAAIDAFAGFRRRHPGHPLEPRATARLIELGGTRAARFTHADRLARAEKMTGNKDWHEAIAELRLIPDSAGKSIVLSRDYWTGTTLFKMRRRYKDAGDILLGLYKKMGKRSAEAMFHGARALSRADFDDEAIKWYLRVVAEYPRTRWAAEAQFLAGWLYFNMGKYREGLPHLERMREKYPRSRFANTAVWYLGYSYFLLGERGKALPYFEKLAKRGGRLEGGKGRYWRARTKWLLGRKAEANTEYKALIARYPFSWYALLAHSRLKRQKIAIDPFGGRKATGAVPAIASKVSARVARDPLIGRADELIDARLGAEAGFELRRGEKAFIKRHDRADAYRVLLDRYRKAGNYNRPWMLAVVVGSRALNMPPTGKARIWWEHGYPRAYRPWVEQYSKVGGNPPSHLYAIMRKESGFNPNIQSYANALGLLQMIPPTTRRVVKELGLAYTEDLLFDPQLNIQTGAWYISRLLTKFKGQIPFGAGSFNSGPRPIMKWMHKFKGHPTDEFVELASYQQTREYMKKVTESYARYLYLYDNVVYEQPLDIDFEFVENKLTY